MRGGKKKRTHEPPAKPKVSQGVTVSINEVQNFLQLNNVYQRITRQLSTSIALLTVTLKHSQKISCRREMRRLPVT